MAKRTVFRDKSTGRFVTRAQWSRSHGSAGRYVRGAVASPIVQTAFRPPSKVSEEEMEELEEELGFPPDFEMPEPTIDLGEDEY